MTVVDHPASTSHDMLIHGPQPVACHSLATSEHMQNPSQQPPVNANELPDRLNDTIDLYGQGPFSPDDDDDSSYSENSENDSDYTSDEYDNSDNLARKMSALDKANEANHMHHAKLLQNNQLAAGLPSFPTLGIATSLGNFMHHHDYQQNQQQLFAQANLLHAATSTGAVLPQPPPQTNHNPYMMHAHALPPQQYQYHQEVYGSQYAHVAPSTSHESSVTIASSIASITAPHSSNTVPPPPPPPPKHLPSSSTVDDDGHHYTDLSQSIAPRSVESLLTAASEAKTQLERMNTISSVVSTSDVTSLLTASVVSEARARLGQLLTSESSTLDQVQDVVTSTESPVAAHLQPDTCTSSSMLDADNSCDGQVNAINSSSCSTSSLDQEQAAELSSNQEGAAASQPDNEQPDEDNFGEIIKKSMVETVSA